MSAIGQLGSGDLTTVPISDGDGSAAAKRGILGSIHEEVSNVVYGMFEKLALFFVRLGKMRMDVGTFGRMLGLCVYGFSAARLTLGHPVKYDISSQLNRTKDMIDIGQGLDGISYFGSKKSKKTLLKSLGNGAMLGASASAAAQILDECKLISLEKAGKAMGSTTLFRNIAKIGITFSQFVGGMVIFGWAAFAVNDVVEAVKTENGDGRKQPLINLAWHTAEIAAAVFGMVAGGCTGGLIALGAAASTLGILSFLHGIAATENQPKTIEGLVLNNY